MPFFGDDALVATSLGLDLRHDTNSLGYPLESRWITSTALILAVHIDELTSELRSCLVNG